MCRLTHASLKTRREGLYSDAQANVPRPIIVANQIQVSSETKPFEKFE